MLPEDNRPLTKIGLCPGKPFTGVAEVWKVLRLLGSSCDEAPVLTTSLGDEAAEDMDEPLLEIALEIAKSPSWTDFLKESGPPTTEQRRVGTCPRCLIAANPSGTLLHPLSASQLHMNMILSAPA